MDDMSVFDPVRVYTFEYFITVKVYDVTSIINLECIMTLSYLFLMNLIVSSLMFLTIIKDFE